MIVGLSIDRDCVVRFTDGPDGPLSSEVRYLRADSIESTILNVRDQDPKSEPPSICSGTVLATVEMPEGWADVCLEWEPVPHTDD